MSSAQIGDAQGEIRSDTQQSLDRSEFSCDARLPRSSGFERRKRFRRRNDWGNERLACACWQLRLKLGTHAWAKNKHTAALAATSKNGRCSTHADNKIQAK